MRTLAIESSDLRGGVALLEDETVLAEECLQGDFLQGKELVPLSARLVSKVGWRPRDIDLVAVDIGPGSFNGIRIGVSIAKSLSLALDRPVAALDRFDLIAFQAGHVVGSFAPVVNAKRGAVALAFFERDRPGRAARRVSEDRSLLPIELAARLDSGQTVFGSGVEAHRAVFEGVGGLAIGQPEWATLRPGTVGRLAGLLANERAVGLDSSSRVLPPQLADELVPLYSRPTAAEERCS